MKSLKIGNLTFKNRIFLAPMVDVTDLPYRLICRKAGAEMAYIEMINAQAIIHENQKTKFLMRTNSKDSPLGIQVTGSSIEQFKKILPELKRYDLVDINCGCPSSRTIDSESGSFLLKNPKKIAEIIKLLKSEGLTVTAKIRLGFNKNEAVKIAKIIEKAGANAITVHARLATHSYETPADLKQIAKVKRAVKIPIIGNGDVDSGKKAEEMLKICDGVMIARAAIGNPLIFKQINNYLKTGMDIKPSPHQNMALLKEYIEIIKKEPYHDISRIKYITSSFIKGFQGASKLRQELMKLKTLNEIISFFERL